MGRDVEAKVLLRMLENGRTALMIATELPTEAIAAAVQPWDAKAGVFLANSDAHGVGDSEHAFHATLLEAFDYPSEEIPADGQLLRWLTFEHVVAKLGSKDDGGGVGFLILDAFRPLTGAEFSWLVDLQKEADEHDCDLYILVIGRYSLSVPDAILTHGLDSDAGRYFFPAIV